MAVTYSGYSLDQLKGPYQGAPVASPLHLCRVAIFVSGTYATGGLNVDLCQAWTGTTAQTTGYGSRSGVTAINVIRAMAFGDYYDGTNTWDVDNASATLSSGGSVTPISAASTNNLVLVKLFTGTNGTGGSEVSNATAIPGGWFSLAFTCQLTYGALGVG